MNLEDAYENIKVTKEEEESLGRYFGFNHAVINMLGNFSPNIYITLKKDGWHFPKNGDELKKRIDDFVNIYSAMYKESRDSKPPFRLIRGTANRHISGLTKEIRRFSSTSTIEEVAKTFCKNGDAALVNFRIKEGVPFLYAERYRDVDRADESEYIIAPFCKIEKNDYISGNESYKHYDITLSKPVLEEKSAQELSELYEKSISGFSKNIENLDRYIELWETEKYLRERHPVATKEVINKIKKMQDESFSISSSINEYSSNLETLLKGLCRQKELQIDKSIEIIEEDKRIKMEQKEAEEKEKARLEEINSLSSKISHTPSRADNLNSRILDTYKKLLDTENIAKQTSKRLGVNLTRVLNNATINERIDKIKGNLTEVKQKCQSSNVTADASLEEVSQISSELTPLLDGVVYGIELTRDFPDIVNSHKVQVDNDIKRNLYEKVHSVIQNARIQKYTREQEDINSERVGFFGRLMGKDILKEEKLKNINLKIKLARTSTPDIKSKYSAKDMLAEIYASSISEFDGQFTPEMAEVFNAIKSVYGNKENETFSDEQISSIAMKKITNKQKENLPVVPDKRKRFFGKNRARAEKIRAENYELQIKIEENVYSGNKWANQDMGKDSIAIFENQLKGISSATRSKAKTREELEKTVYLWGED